MDATTSGSDIGSVALTEVAKLVLQVILPREPFPCRNNNYFIKSIEVYYRIKKYLAYIQISRLLSFLMIYCAD